MVHKPVNSIPAAVLLLMVLPLYAAEEDAMHSDFSIWRGTVSFNYQEKGRGTNKESTSSYSKLDEQWDFSNNFEVTVDACGLNLEKAYVKRAAIAYFHSWKSTEEYVDALCDDERGFLRKKVKPGLKIFSEGERSAYVNPQLIGARASLTLSVDEQPSEGVLKYHIAGGLNPDFPMAFITENSEGRQISPCDKTVSSHKLRLLPMSGEPSTNCSEDGRNCISQAPEGTAAFPIDFSFIGTASMSNISGSTQINIGSKEHLKDGFASLVYDMEKVANAMPPELKAEMMQEIEKIKREFKEERPSEAPAKDSPEKNKGETTATLHVSWNLSKIDVCSDIADLLQNDLSLIMAYADEDLLKRAQDGNWTGEQYDMAVLELGIKIYARQWWKSGTVPGSKDVKKPDDDDGHSLGMDMAVDNETCEILFQEEKRDALEKGCYPQILYESLLAHERAHARQCMSEKTGDEFRSRTPESFKKFETEGYCAGAKRLLEWADGNCSDSEMKPFRDAYGSYCGK